MKRVLSIHWGFSIGGVGKYTTIIDRVSEFSNVDIYSIVILSPGVHVDRDTMQQLRHLDVIELAGKWDISWLWKLRRLLLSHPADLVMTHGFNGHFLMLIQRYLLAVRLPLVCSYHGQYHATTPFRKMLGVAFNSLTEFYIRHCVKGAIAVADYCRCYLAGKRVNVSKVVVIHNGIENKAVDLTQRDTLREAWQVGPSELLFGVASRIDPVKGIDYLVDAFVLLAPRYPKIKLVVIGTGTLEKSLKEKVAQENLTERVIFTGFRSDIDHCLSAMDIFVLPSLAEYHSIALLEAMRAEKAIISTDVGGNTESVSDQKEALIVPCENVSALENAMMQMLDDDALRVKLSSAARQRFLDTFSEEKTIEKTANWLLDLASGN